MNGGTHADDLGRANALEVNLHEDDLREIALRGYEGQPRRTGRSRPKP